MNVSVIDKILGFTFPEDIVVTIASYFIQKIPKIDNRFWNIKQLFISRHFFLKERLYPDGSLHSKIFSRQDFYEQTDFYFALYICPIRDLIEYIYHHGNKSRVKHIRFWLDGKCDEHINGNWVIKK